MMMMMMMMMMVMMMMMMMMMKFFIITLVRQANDMHFTKNRSFVILSFVLPSFLPIWTLPSGVLKPSKFEGL